MSWPLWFIINCRKKCKVFIDNFFIAGPCVLESDSLCMDIAFKAQEICKENGFEYFFKTSFDKANRTSIDSFRGPGLEKSLDTFSKLKKAGIKVCTDVHTPDQPSVLKDYVDIIQIPAFLCRQTDLIVESAKTNKIVNIKKAQFLSVDKIKYCIDKCKSMGNNKVMLTERGTNFGPNELVVDFRNITLLKQYGLPVIIDCTHSCQQITSGNITGGNREFAPLFAKTGVIFGTNGIFSEIHFEPDKALSDKANTISLETFNEIAKWWNEYRGKQKTNNIC